MNKRFMAERPVVTTVVLAKTMLSKGLGRRGRYSNGSKKKKGQMPFFIHSTSQPNSFYFVPSQFTSNICFAIHATKPYICEDEPQRL